jgi:hypothetical protein
MQLDQIPRSEPAFETFVQKNVPRANFDRGDVGVFVDFVSRSVRERFGGRSSARYGGSYYRHTAIDGSDVDVHVRTPDKDLTRADIARFKDLVESHYLVKGSVGVGQFSLKVKLRDETDVDLVFRNRGFGKSLDSVDYPTLRGTSDREAADSSLDEFYHHNLHAQNAVRLLKWQIRGVNSKLPGYVIEHLVMNISEGTVGHDSKQGHRLYFAALDELQMGQNSSKLRHMITDADGNEMLVQKTVTMLRKTANFCNNGKSMTHEDVKQRVELKRWDHGRLESSGTRSQPDRGSEPEKPFFTTGFGKILVIIGVLWGIGFLTKSR